MRRSWTPARGRHRVHRGEPDRARGPIRSDPAGGAQVDEGATVGLAVSGGPDTITVPNVVGLTEDRAISTLEAQGRPRQHHDRADRLPRGRGQRRRDHPGEGSQAAPGAPIRLQISTARSRCPTSPAEPRPKARDALVEAGFSAGRSAPAAWNVTTRRVGRVVGTDPEAGSAVGAGEGIALLVAVPTPPEPTPTSTPATTTPATPTETSTSTSPGG